MAIEQGHAEEASRLAQAHTEANFARIVRAKLALPESLLGLNRVRRARGTGEGA